MIKRQIMKAGGTVYRDLPIGGTARRKVRALFLARGDHEPFVHPWRDMKVWIDLTQSLDTRVYYTGDYEPETMAAIQLLAAPGSSVIDVGANTGFVSLWCSKCVGPAGSVVAIEPSNWAVERIRRNIALNDIANVETIPAAVSDAPGEAEIQVINGYRVDDISTHSRQHVKFVTIDDVVRERGITKLTLLKVDTDGYEVGVFRGAKQTLAELRPTLVFEVGPDHLQRAGSSREALIALLRESGYEFLTEAFKPVDPLAIHIEKNGTINLIGRPL